jgi:hypothetical protein
LILLRVDAPGLLYCHQNGLPNPNNLLHLPVVVSLTKPVARFQLSAFREAWCEAANGRTDLTSSSKSHTLEEGRAKGHKYA